MYSNVEKWVIQKNTAAYLLTSRVSNVSTRQAQVNYVRLKSCTTSATHNITQTLEAIEAFLIMRLHCALPSCGAVYCKFVIGPVCGFVCLWWAGGRCPNLTTASARAQCLRLAGRFFRCYIDINIDTR